MLTYALHHTEYVMYGMIYCKYNGEMKSAVPGTADRNKENAKANATLSLSLLVPHRALYMTVQGFLSSKPESASARNRFLPFFSWSESWRESWR